jgi:hypothetical protein
MLQYNTIIITVASRVWKPSLEMGTVKLSPSKRSIPSSQSPTG